jgi:peptidyl-lysine (3S)-dioxygenase / protease
MHKHVSMDTQRILAIIANYQHLENDNLRGEYLSLFEDVQKEIAWARIALNKEPEAINLWIGNSRSVTALHKDNYENIYCQILGNKHFTLLPPVEVGCVAEKDLRSATYVWDADGALAVKEDEPAQTLPFPTWDPDIPHLRPTQFSHLSKPLRVTLQAGDMLYLPALW